MMDPSSREAYEAALDLVNQLRRDFDAAEDLVAKLRPPRTEPLTDMERSLMEAYGPALAWELEQAPVFRQFAARPKPRWWQRRRKVTFKVRKAGE